MRAEQKLSPIRVCIANLHLTITLFIHTSVSDLCYSCSENLILYRGHKHKLHHSISQVSVPQF